MTARAAFLLLTGVCLLGSPALHAQPNVELGVVEQPGGYLEFRLLPNGPFNGIVSSSVISVRWSTTAGVAVPGASAEFVTPGFEDVYGPLLSFGTVTDGGYSYATWVTLGFDPLGAEYAWVGSSEVPLFRVPYNNTSGACIEFEVLDDTFQALNNRQWAISLAGLDRHDGYIPGKTSAIGSPDAVCQNISATLSSAGTVSITPEAVSDGFLGCPPVILSLDVDDFTCADLGANTVTLTADANGRITSCTATVTVLQVDTDGDGVLDCLDACPLDPLKSASAGICGCGEPDIDTNNNGICDALEVPPNVQLGIVEEPGGYLEFRLLPDDYFDGIISNTVMTVRWPTTAGVSVTGGAAAYVDPAYEDAAGPLLSFGTVSDGGYSYATWVTVSNLDLGAPLAWSSGVEVPLFRVPYVNTTGACITFEVVDDQFQADNNRLWYISLSGQDKTDGYIAGKTQAIGFPDAVCQNISATLSPSGTVSISAEAINAGFLGCPPVSLSLDVDNFTCANLGANTVTLTADANGRMTSCTATVTVLQVDTDGDGVLDCLDACPLDPLKSASPGICGCGEVDIDLNNNGFCDATEFPPNVQLGIVEQPGGVLEFRLLPDDYFDGIISNSVITVRWPTTAGVSVTGGAAAYVNPEYEDIAGPLLSFGTITGVGYTYATWVTVGTVDLGAPNAWSSGVEVPFFRVPYVNTSGDCITFEVVDDQFQIDNNRLWYISLSGEDKTDGYIAGKTMVLGNSTPVCQNISLSLDAFGAVTVPPAQLDPNSGSYCGVASATASPASFTCADIGPNAVTLTLFYTNGNSASCTATVTVVDDQAPVITCPPNTYTDMDPGQCGAVVNGLDPVVVENCSYVLTYARTGAVIDNGSGSVSGLFFPKDITYVTYTVTDPSGQSNTCSFEVGTVDTELPQITCPGNILINNEPGLCGAIVNYVAPVGTDNCPGSFTDLTAGLAPGSFFPVGVTTVTYTVTDPVTLPVSCSFTVTVVDVDAPVPDVAVLPSLTDECAVTVGSAPTASDNCAGAINGTTADPLVYTAQGTYTITWTYNDGNGNTATQTQTVVVDDVTAPEFSNCPGNISVTNDAGDCSGATVVWMPPSVSDNCDANPNVTLPVWSPGDFFPLGNTTVTYTASDASGNPASCSFTVNVFILDTDNDGVCDEFDLCNGPEPGSPCDDLDPNTINDVIQLDCGCAGTLLEVKVELRVVLDGAYVVGDGLMRDVLRTLPGFPLGHPYAAAPFLHAGTETVSPMLLTVAGNDAVVDWVLVELRSGTNSSIIVASLAALVQRDGDVMTADGLPTLQFLGVPDGNYHVVVRHRNHLGAMTDDALALDGVPTAVDLSSNSVVAYGTEARKTVAGLQALWAGNVIPDVALKYLGSSNDRDPMLIAIGGSPSAVLSSTYHPADITLDGQVKYLGSGNDRDLLLLNIGGAEPTAVRFEQLP